MEEDMGATEGAEEEGGGIRIILISLRGPLCSPLTEKWKRAYRT